jgi:hypothetical protein
MVVLYTLLRPFFQSWLMFRCLMTTSTHIFHGVYFLRGVKQQTVTAEAESKEKHGVWDPMPGVTITSLYVHSRVDSNTFTKGNPYARVDLNLICQSRLYSPVRDFGFGLWLAAALLAPKKPRENVDRQDQQKKVKTKRILAERTGEAR